MTTLAADKRAVRATLRARLDALPLAAFVDAGVAVAAHLAPWLPERGVVACFASRARELDTAPLIALARARGLRVALPRMDGDDLAFVVVDDVAALPLDRLGIPAPEADAPAVDVAACALVVVPGLGFDERGGRLGYGRGYYDRVLSRGDVVDRAIGVFLDEQRVACVPMGAHDVRLRRVCTPARGVVHGDGVVDVDVRGAAGVVVVDE
jgi:5-formyltetrahydrofolate cyclo-ligase